MRNRVVAHPDRPGQSLLPDLQQRLPRFVSQLGHWPVNEIQVHILESELASAPDARPQCGLESLFAVPHFADEETLHPAYHALRYRAPHAPPAYIQSRRTHL